MTLPDHNKKPAANLTQTDVHSELINDQERGGGNEDARKAVLAAKIPEGLRTITTGDSDSSESPTERGGGDQDARELEEKELLEDIEKEENSQVRIPADDSKERGFA